MKSKPSQTNESLIDHESELHLNQMKKQQTMIANRISRVKFVLVVLSSRGMVFDIESIRQKVHLAYPDSAVFFMTTLGKPIGPSAPNHVDLLIDLTGPSQRQGWFFARKLRRQASFAVGRNAGLFRKRIYDRVFDEKKEVARVPAELLSRERYVQREVLLLAGVDLVPTGEVGPDQSKSIALSLPGIQRMK